MPPDTHDQEDWFVMIVERVLGRIKPAKKESQDGARAKKEEDGSPPRSCGRRLVSWIHFAARLPSLFHRSLGPALFISIFFLSTFQRIAVVAHRSRRLLAKPFGVALCVGGSFISIFDLLSSIF
jgi:hypothetical protein